MTARLTPEEFAEDLLARRMSARAVLVGENFRFGCRQAGDVRTLQALGERLGFAVEIVPAVRFRGQVVSSSSIRALISEGRVALANRLLGRPYALEGRVVEGRGVVGSKQTVPTLNLETEAEVISGARGVYAHARQRNGRGHEHRLPADFWQSEQRLSIEGRSC